VIQSVVGEPPEDCAEYPSGLGFLRYVDRILKELVPLGIVLICYMVS